MDRAVTGDIEQAARLDGRRAAGVVRPRRTKPPAAEAERRRCRRWSRRRPSFPCRSPAPRRALRRCSVCTRCGCPCSCSSRSTPSLPPCTAYPFGSSPGDVEPRSASLELSCAWFGGVQWPTMRDAVGESTMTLSPKFVRPLYGPLPVATNEVTVRWIDRGAVARPDRASHWSCTCAATMMACRSAHSEFQTCTMRPLAAPIVTT